MPLQIVQGDITKMRTDAIVNAANNRLLAGAGVCGAIFQAAGNLDMRRACNEIGGCETGKAVATLSFNLNCSYVIHTVGPVWRGGEHSEAALLENCYLNSMALAKEKGCKSIAFPLISAGVYGYPKYNALRIAVESINTFLMENEMSVYLVLYDKESLSTCKAMYGEARPL